MKITIFTPTYNRKNTLLRLIGSLEEQEFTDWELIIVDDGSSDGTSETLQKKNSQKIKYIPLKKNAGHPEALFKVDICSLLTGDLIIFMGSDDYFLDKYSLQKIIDTFAKHSHNVWKIGFTWLHENAINEGQSHFKHLPDIRSLCSDEVVQDSYFQSDYLFIYRKEYWEEYSTYFSSQDHFFSSFYDVALNHKYEEVIYKHPVMVAGWGEDNLTKGANADKYFKWSLIHQKYMLNTYYDRMSPHYLNYSMRSFMRSSLSHGIERRMSFDLANKASKLAIKFMVTAILGYVAVIWPFPKIVWHLKRLALKSQKRRK